MKKITLCFLILFQFSICAFSQKASVKWGDIISDEKQTKFNILGEDENSIYIFRFQHDHKDISIPFLVIVNKKSLEITKSKELQFPVPEDGDLHLHNVFFLKDKFVMFVSLTNTKNKTDRALAYEVSKNGDVNSKYTVVLEKENAPKDGTNFRFVITPDSTRFVAIANVYNNYKAAAFDKDMNGLWAGEFTLTAEKKSEDIWERGLETDMNANLFVFYIGSGTNTMLFSYNGKDKEVKRFDIIPTSKTECIFQNTGRFIHDEDGLLAYVNLYGNKTHEDAYGVAIVKYADGNIQTLYKPFSTKLRTAFMSDSKAAKPGEEVGYIVLDDVIENFDKSFDVIIHEFAPRVFNAAAATMYDKNWNEVWSAPVAIRYTKLDEYFWFANMITKNELCFLFIDHRNNVDNLDSRSSRWLADLDHGVSVLARISLKDGSIKKEPLFTSNELETYLMPYKCVQSGSNSMLLFGKKKSEIRFGKLTIE